MTFTLTAVRAPRALRASVAALCTAGLLAACAEGGGMQAPNVSRNQAVGAGAGAALGAAAGLLVGGDDRRNALVGAGIGLLAGAAAGTYLDRQEDELRQGLSGSGAEVQNTGDALLVTLPGGVTFPTDSAEVRAEFRRPLNSIAETLQKYPSSYVDVIGYTDSTGEESYNQRLSERRAASVANELIARGVSPARIEVAGRGEANPVASNDTESGRAQNRRVEIRIVPATQS